MVKAVQSAASLEGSKLQHQLGSKSPLSLASGCSARALNLHIKRSVWGWGTCRRRETEGGGAPPPPHWVIPPVAASGQVPSAPCLYPLLCFHSNSVHGHWDTQSSLQPGTAQLPTEAAICTALSAPTCLSSSRADQNSNSLMVEVRLSLLLKRQWCPSPTWRTVTLVLVSGCHGRLKVNGSAAGDAFKVTHAVPYGSRTKILNGRRPILKNSVKDRILVQ